jgi:hypothetical protein
MCSLGTIPWSLCDHSVDIALKKTREGIWVSAFIIIILEKVKVLCLRMMMIILWVIFKLYIHFQSRVSLIHRKLDVWKWKALTTLRFVVLACVTWCTVLRNGDMETAVGYFMGRRVRSLWILRSDYVCICRLQVRC